MQVYFNLKRNSTIFFFFWNFALFSQLKQNRGKLLESFADPSRAVTAVETELNAYVSLLYGFLTDVSGNTTGDSKLRFSTNYKWSNSLGIQITRCFFFLNSSQTNIICLFFFLKFKRRTRFCFWTVQYAYKCCSLVHKACSLCCSNCFWVNWTNKQNKNLTHN